MTDFYSYLLAYQFGPASYLNDYKNRTGYILNNSYETFLQATATPFTLVIK